MSDTTRLADTVNAVLEQTIPVAHSMGVRAVEVHEGYASARVPFAGNGNHFGVVYAGVLFTVAEVLGGALALASFDSTRFYPLVKDARITFTRAASTDITATASLEPATIAAVAREAGEHGKADFSYDAELTDAGGSVVATTHNVCQLRAHGI